MRKKALITSEFFCSYFYHSALPHWKEVRRVETAPEKYYHGITAIILFQCTLESYINHMIYEHNVDSEKIGKRKLIELSIKEKWSEFPRIVTGQTYDETQQPFLDFRQLVDLRNKLIHFKSKEMRIEIELPKPTGVITFAELRGFINQPGVLSGHVLMDIVPMAIAGRYVTINMIQALHSMLKSEPPKFLTKHQVAFAMKLI